MKSMKKYLLAMMAVCAFTSASAQDKVLTTLYVNKEVTTHLIMPETIRLVDISTDKVVGNQVSGHLLVDIESCQNLVLCYYAVCTQGYESHCC